MNTKIIHNSKTERLPVFPPTKKTRRIVTKHFTNLAMYMDREKYAMISWLIYQCAMDNTIEYRHFLIKRYAESIKAANEFYGVKPDLNISPQKLRLVLRDLIRDGHILSIGGKTLLISPILTYCEYLSKKQHEYVCNRYSALGNSEIKEFCEFYRELANPIVKNKAF